MPADRDARGTASSTLPDVVTDTTNDVGFIDADGLDPSTIAAAIEHAFRSLAAGAVLAIHGVPAADLDSICGRCRLELITTIRHSSGSTTSTIRQQPAAPDDDTERPDGC